ncbi:MAG: hypothetical protein FJX78_04840 [Armatimonadetes bacterium]|nr:hypothetical protein [Armatimonadota bacterium]
MSNEGFWGAFLGNLQWAWGSALAVAAGTFVALLLARRLLLGALRRSLRAEDPGIADLVARLLHRTWLVLVALSV